MPYLIASEFVHSLLFIFGRVVSFFLFASIVQIYTFLSYEKEIKYNICLVNFYFENDFFITNLKIYFILAEIQGEKV